MPTQFWQSKKAYSILVIKKSLLNFGNQKCLFNPGDQKCLFNPGSQKKPTQSWWSKMPVQSWWSKTPAQSWKFLKKCLLSPGDQKCLLNPGDQKKPTQSWQSKKACSILVIKKKEAYSILVTKKSLLNPRQVTEIFFVSVLIGCKTCPRESGNNKKTLMISNLALLLVALQVRVKQAQQWKG